jgi:hypothetical protein
VRFAPASRLSRWDSHSRCTMDTRHAAPPRWVGPPSSLTIVAGLVVYVEGTSGGSASQAAQYRYYFEEAKRMCRAIDAGLKPKPLPCVTVWNGGGVGPFLKLPNIPAKYRSAVTAGSNAAA